MTEPVICHRLVGSYCAWSYATCSRHLGIKNVSVTGLQCAASTHLVFASGLEGHSFFATNVNFLPNVLVSVRNSGLCHFNLFTIELDSSIFKKSDFYFRPVRMVAVECSYSTLFISLHFLVYSLSFWGSWATTVGLGLRPPLWANRAREGRKSVSNSGKDNKRFNDTLLTHTLSYKLL